jgi:hypothetical protein
MQHQNPNRKLEFNHKTNNNNQSKKFLAGKKSNQANLPMAELELYLQEATVEIETLCFPQLVEGQLSQIPLPCNKGKDNYDDPTSFDQHFVIFSLTRPML